MKGIAIAVTAGKYKGRKPIEYPKLWERYCKMMQDGDISGVDVMKILDLKKTTFYKLINQYEEGFSAPLYTYFSVKYMRDYISRIVQKKSKLIERNHHIMQIKGNSEFWDFI